jgi:SAM-dependent methyltransferase
MSIKLGTFADFEALKNETDSMNNEIDRIEALCRFAVKDPSLQLDGDPFSKEYMECVLNSYSIITRKSNYSVFSAELSPFVDPAKTAVQPSIYSYGDSSFLGDFLISFGAILRAMRLKSNDAILEYGAGDGQISLMLARMGCKVSVIDIEQRYLDAINLQTQALHIGIDSMLGQFGDNFPDDRKYDCILFFEAFHHCIHHQVVLKKIKGFLKPNGRIVFSGEPIIDPDGHWKDVVPFAWGPRLDGLSLRAMRNFGWCELGFQRPYFEELLRRSGFSFEFIPCPMTARGDCYVATLQSSQESEQLDAKKTQNEITGENDVLVKSTIDKQYKKPADFFLRRLWSKFRWL